MYWEYDIHYRYYEKVDDLTEKLNKMGSEGWEMVQIDFAIHKTYEPTDYYKEFPNTRSTYRAVFKRMKMEPITGDID